MRRFPTHQTPGKLAGSPLAVDVFKFRREGKIATKAASVTLDGVDGGAAAVPLAWQSIYHGGIHAWFVCPQCSARRRFLHVHEGRVACRECFGLSYRSLRQGWPSARVLRQVVKLRAKLGGSTALLLAELDRIAAEPEDSGLIIEGEVAEPPDPAAPPAA
jgi:hypothetical protein